MNLWTCLGPYDFIFRRPYTIIIIVAARCDIHLVNRNMHTEDFGTNTIFSLGPKLWKLAQDKKNIPQHYQLLKPRLSLWPSTTAHVYHAKYLLRILVLLKFVQVSNATHTNAYSFLKIFLKENLEHVDFSCRTYTQFFQYIFH